MTTKNVKHIYGDDTEIAYVRLIADEGKVLTNGTNEWNCVDVLPDEAGQWSEVDASATDEPISDAEALEIITGGTT